MARFEWDPAKARANERKHGVSFQEAAEVFDDPMAMISYDQENSEREDRYRILGMTSRSKLLVTAFAEKEAETIRIISARRASSTDRRDYEANLPKNP